MSTILDALKKVERERESPSDRLRHEPQAPARRSRRVSTATIVVCAILGFAAGAGIALWRSEAPLPDEGPVAVAAPPRIAVPAPDAEVRAPAPARPAAERAPIDDGSALEPSPFEPPPAADDPVVAAAPAPWVPPAPAVRNGRDEMDAMDELGDRGALGALGKPAAAIPPVPAAAGLEAPPAREAVDVALAPGPDVELQGAVPDAEILQLDEAPPSAEPAASQEPEETVIDTGRSPPGAPQVTLSFLQWSADPARRFAFVSIDGAPSQRVREGDAAGAASVDRITPDGVRFRHEDTVFVIRPRH